MAKGAYVGIPTKTQLVIPITAENFYQFFDRYEVEGDASYTPGGVAIFKGRNSNVKFFFSEAYKNKSVKISFTYDESSPARAGEPGGVLELDLIDEAGNMGDYIWLTGEDIAQIKYYSSIGFMFHQSGQPDQAFIPHIGNISLLFEDDDSTAELGPSVARKVKKIYTGVDNVARKVKKGYVGVGGVARPFFSAESRLEYYGAITPLSVARGNLAATTVGNYALFGGGGESRNYTDTVDAYDASLTRSTPTALSVVRQDLAATTVGNYALFGGGSYDIFSSGNAVDAYASNLTRSTPTDLSEDRAHLAATTVGNYALFGGGSNFTESDTVDAYDASLTRSTPTVLSVARSELTATTVGNFALFGGGSVGSYTDTVDAYDASLTRSTPTVLSVARSDLAATTVGNYALFGGGEGRRSPYIDTVDAYDASLTRSTPTVLSVERDILAATTVGNYALFGGGSNKDTVDAYYST